MQEQPISQTVVSSNTAAATPGGGGTGGGFFAMPAQKTKALTEQLGYANDADLIAELREVLALSAASKMAPLPPAGSASTRRRSAG